MNPAEFADHLCAHFAVEQRGPRSVMPAGQGSVGVVWRLEAGGAQYAVKEFLWGVEQSEVEREVAFRDLTAEAGVLSPANIPASGGGHLVRLPPELGGKFVRVYEWLEGTPVRVGDPSVAGLVGEAMGRMHALKALPSNDPDPWYFVSPDEAAWSALAAAASQTRASWAGELAAAVPRMLELAALTARLPADAPQVLHLDLQPSNLLMVGERLAVLDWDGTDTGSAERELGFVLAHWHISDRTVDTAGVSQMMTSYHDAGGEARPRELSSFGMRIATHLNYVLCQAELALDVTADAATRRTALERTENGLAHLPRESDFLELLES